MTAEHETIGPSERMERYVQQELSSIVPFKIRPDRKCESAERRRLRSLVTPADGASVFRKLAARFEYGRFGRYPVAAVDG